MSTTPSTLELDRPRDGVVVVRLNRPERLNAINEVMQIELGCVLDDFATDQSVHAVVLTGAGRGFCAGIDMRDFGPNVPEATAPALDRMRFQEKMAALAEAVRQLPQPVIAAVNGPCVGAGLALCLAANIRICSAEASFGNAAILLGLSGAAGLAQRSLVLGVGVHRAGGQRDGGTPRRKPSGDRLTQPSAAAGDQSHHPVTPWVSVHRRPPPDTRSAETASPN
jgi:enoyl-CoA hydratase/carnithine racemase